MKFYVFRTTVLSENNEESYGIMYQTDGMKNFICDVSDDYDSVKSLADEMNSSDIEPCHIDDVIADFRFNNNN